MVAIGPFLPTSLIALDRGAYPAIMTIAAPFGFAAPGVGNSLEFQGRHRCTVIHHDRQAAIGGSLPAPSRALRRLVA